MSLISFTTITDGTTADAADVNTPLTTIYNDYNGNITDANIASAAAIAANKLAGGVAGMFGAWSSWTPTWTNFTTGNGTLNYAKFIQLGKTVHFRLKFTHGSTSVVGTIPGFSLPATMNSDYVANDPVSATVELNDATGFRNPAIALVGSTTRIDLYWVNTSITIQSITSTAPFTWTTSDQFMISGSYEAA